MRHCTALLCLFLVPTFLGAGAWTPKKGKTYLKISGNFFESFANYDRNGDEFDPFTGREGEYARFRDEQVFVYAETGLTDQLALIGNLTYKSIEQKLVTQFLEVDAVNSGLADLELGLAYNFHQSGSNVWTTQLLAKLPYFYDGDDDFFELGNGQEDLEARLLYGRGLPHGFYLGAEAGYRLRTGDPSDLWRYLVELGWSGDRVYARTKLNGTRSVDNVEELDAGLSNPILNPQYELDTVEVSFGYHLSKTWFLEYTYLDTIAGKNTAVGDNQQLALIVNF